SSVGLSVIRGRLPGWITLGVPANVFRLLSRLPWIMPVRPATPAVLDRPLGVAAITFPNLSVTHMTVVPPCQGPVMVGGFVGFMLYGSPGRSSRDASFGSISLRRISVYSLESNSCIGTLVKFGSP